METKRKELISLGISLITLILLLTYMFVIKNTVIHEYSINIEEIVNKNYTNEKPNETNNKQIIKDLRKKYNNNDVKGVIKIKNTDYASPIMQTYDNDFYLNHTPTGKENINGSIFLDYRVDIEKSKKLLIYGHNSADIEMPFSILEEFYNKNYYDNHRYIEVITESKTKTYEIFSVYVETHDFSYMKTNFNTKTEYKNHIEKLKEKSIHPSDINLSSDDEILILQTCSTHKDYKNYSKKYLLIIARRVLNE